VQPKQELRQTKGVEVAKKNGNIIKETSRHPEEICKADEETSITGEEAIGDGEEPKGQVNA
jgi:hypothetical protein